MLAQSITAFVIDDEFQSRKVISLMLNKTFAEVSITDFLNLFKG
jgi:hypothetical protein